MLDRSAGGEVEEDVVPKGQGGGGAEGKGGRHETEERRPHIQHPPAPRGRLFPLEGEAPRRPLQPELRRGGRTIRQHAQLCRFLQRGEHQQPRPRVSQIPERGHIRFRRGERKSLSKIFLRCELSRKFSSSSFSSFPDPGSEQVQGHHQDKDDRVDVHGGVRDNRVGGVRGGASMGPPVDPGRVRPRVEESVVEHQRAEFQPLRTQDGHQSRPRHGWGDRGQEASLRHMGEHRERRVQDGEHREGGLHPGEESPSDIPPRNKPSIAKQTWKS